MGYAVDMDGAFTDAPLDSPEGIARFIEWARAHHMVLSCNHRTIADRHGVDVSGVTFSDYLPNVRLVDSIPAG